MSKCNCSMSISVLGDGCRYCQPQTYIDKLSEIIEDERSEHESELATLKAKAAVVMPEQASANNTVASDAWRNGWNTCLDEFERLNRSKT